MANEKEIVTVLEVQTGRSYESINDLKAAVKGYREEMNAATIGSEEYNDAQANLTKTQEVLKQVTKQATAAQAENWEGVDLGTKSYNELTQQMKALNAEWRATNDEAQRNELSGQILAINNRLKDLDASTGNFQRSVGDYANGVKKGLDAFTKGVGNAIPSLRSLNAVADGFAKNPFVATVGIIVQLLARVIQNMKSTEEGQARINKLMTALNKILEPINAVISWIADAVGDLIDWLGEALPKVTNWLGKVSAKMAGVGNAILQFLLAPLRSMIAVVKGIAKIIGDIFTGKWGKVKEDAKNIGTDIGAAWKKGFDVKANYETGKAAGEKVIAGIASRANRKKAKEAGQQVGKAAAEGVTESFADQVEKNLAIALQKSTDAAKKRAQEWAETVKMIEDAEAELTQEVDELTGDQADALLASFEARKEAMQGFTKSSIALLGDLADALEASEDGARKHDGAIKALRAAETIINTISGAMGAFMGITKDTGGWGIALAAVQAASIMATGYANVRKILATDTSTKASTTSVSTASVPAVSAPQMDYTPQTVTTATTSQEVQRLNQGRGDQRVYVVYSDIAQAGKQVAVQQAESSFR